MEAASFCGRSVSGGRKRMPHKRIIYFLVFGLFASLELVYSRIKLLKKQTGRIV